MILLCLTVESDKTRIAAALVNYDIMSLTFLIVVYWSSVRSWHDFSRTAVLEVLRDAETRTIKGSFLKVSSLDLNVAQGHLRGRLCLKPAVCQNIASHASSAAKTSLTSVFKVHSIPFPPNLFKQKVF